MWLSLNNHLGLPDQPAGGTVGSGGYEGSEDSPFFVTPRFVTNEQFEECLCDFISIYRLRRLFLLLARWLYSSPANYGDYQSVLPDTRYTEDSDSNLNVDLFHAFDPNESTTKPAIYVGVGQQGFQKVGLSDRSGRTDDGAVAEYVWNSPTMITIACVHRDADMALILAEIASTFFMGIRELLVRRLEPVGLEELQPFALTEISKKEQKPDESYRVDFQMKLTYTWSVQTHEESLRIKKIAQLLNVE